MEWVISCQDTFSKYRLTLNLWKLLTKFQKSIERTDPNGHPCTIWNDMIFTSKTSQEELLWKVETTLCTLQTKRFSGEKILDFFSSVKKIVCGNDPLYRIDEWWTWWGRGKLWELTAAKSERSILLFHRTICILYERRHQTKTKKHNQKIARFLP